MQSMEKSSEPAGKFQNKAPCEDPRLIKQVLDRSLDTHITLSQRELLAVSADARRNMKDLTTPKKVPAQVEANLVDSEPNFLPLKSFMLEKLDLVSEGYTVAEDVVSLRVISATINYTDKLECILDSGSSIVAMNKDVWKRLGLPLRSDQFLLMENVDGGRRATVRQLSNVPFTIGHNTFWLQVQVVKNCPCEILLGRPFMTLTSCRTRDYPNGSSNITIVDLNTQAMLTVPTYAHTCKERSAGFQDSMIRPDTEEI